MEIKHKSHKKRNIILIVTAALIAVAVAGALVYAMTRPKASQAESTKTTDGTNSINYNPPTEQEKQTGTQAKEDFMKRDEAATQPSPAPPAGTSSISISNVSQDQATLKIRTIIASTSATGTCTLTLSKQGETSITQSVDVQNVGSYSTCKGFDVNVSGLKKDTWNISIQYSGDQTGVAATKTVGIQ